MVAVSSLKKNFSTFSLMMTGITSMVGSGWLLATQKISTVAGPAGLLTWGIGMLVVVIIALFSVELGTSHPSAGGIGYYSQLTHGRFSGFLTQFINWLSVLAVPAVEAQAIVCYLSSVTPQMHAMYDMHQRILTPLGIMVALGFMLIFMFINYFGSKLFIRINNLLTVIKIIIPLLTIACLLYMGLHPGNFGTSSIDSFAPYGLRSIFVAVIGCGVIMSFNGFQIPLNFSEEIESPKRQLPIAIIGSIAITFVLYVLLQVVFIGSVSSSQLLHGWHMVNYRSPYVDLLVAVNCQVLAWAVMSTSMVAPASCGSAFIASSSRILYNLSRAKLLPSFLKKVNIKYSSLQVAIVTNTILSSCFLFVCKGWGQLVAVISVLHVFSYLSIPVVVVAYRKQFKGLEKNVFKMPFASFFAVIILFILAVLMFFAAWPSIAYLALLLIPGIIIFCYYEYHNNQFAHIGKLLKSGGWIIYFLFGIVVISYLGNNNHHLHNLISLTMSMLLLLILTITSFIYGVKSATIEQILK